MRKVPIVTREGQHAPRLIELHLACEVSGCSTLFGPFALAEPDDALHQQELAAHQAAIRGWRLIEKKWHCRECSEAPL